MRSRRARQAIAGLQRAYGAFGRKLMVWLVLSVPSTARYRVARLLSLQCRAAAQVLDAIPTDQLARTVLFVSLQPHSREPRLAAAAQIAGWSTFLVYTGRPKYDPNEHFRFHARVRNLLQLVLVSWLFKGPVIHLFALGGHEAYPLCASRTRPVILDLYDTVSGMTWVSGEAKREEQRAIQLASAVTHRDLRLKYLHELYHYSLPRHNMFIHDPVPGPELPENQPKQDGEIHVVSTGWVSVGDNGILRTATALCDAGIHVHVFLNPLQAGAGLEMQGYRALQRRSACFHFELPVYGDAYWNFLRRCDFGLAIFEPDIFGQPSTAYTTDYLQGCGSSRLMDYVRMNLGVIASPTLRFQYWLARRYASVVVPATQEFLRDPRPVLEASLQERARVGPRNIAAITARGAARRLGRFYEQVALGSGSPGRGSVPGAMRR